MSTSEPQRRSAAVVTPRRRGWSGTPWLVFPLLTHAWPLLLVVSQKALVPLGLLLAGTGTAAYRRNLAVVAAMVAVALLGFALQPPNEHGQAHLIGYALFLLAIPLINLAVRTDRDRLVHGLAWFSVLNAALAFVFYFAQVDLSGFRGLNRIVGDDDLAHRVYFESTSLVAVFSATRFRPRWLRAAASLLVLAYAVLLARSVFVVTLFALNLMLPTLMQASLPKRMFALLLVASLAVLGPLAVAVLRPDVALSIGIKLLQFQVIVDAGGAGLFGAGWGTVIDEIVNSEEQPYQVEMQLPMLLHQIGPAGVAAYAVGLALLLRSASATAGVAGLRWLVCLAIGFNNPWLFVPSWYLTCVLLFMRMEERT